MVGYGFMVLVLLVLIYFVFAFVLSRMSVAQEPETKKEISIYILTNGVHTDLVVPVKSNVIDWTKYVKYSHTKGNDTTARYLGFGWGDKGFYLETPTWADLKVSTAFEAMTGLSSSAIHATFMHAMVENDACKRIDISQEQYERLAKFIIARFDLDARGDSRHIVTNANYGMDDAFYEAKGSYNLFYTCNTWANAGLKACGQKAAIWTPFYQGIFYHYK
ncbi:urease-associated protein [Rufibacter radiotolerans]|uniref:Urease-associated protein n=1 Tax=Rufibacter radiotolerans TaxID=1379910 RepID=A0A0H4VNQ2_9BACT|nr:urease-associated protein [Rufibacter radiotolerans]